MDQINLSKVRQSDFLAQNSQYWSTKAENLVFWVKFRFAWHYQCNLLLLQNVFSKDFLIMQACAFFRMCCAYLGVLAYFVPEVFEKCRDKELLEYQDIFWSDFGSKWSDMVRFSCNIGQIFSLILENLVNFY